MMSMIESEKSWNKSSFAKAEKRYYEMLSQDMCSESIEFQKLVDVKQNVQRNSGCVRSKKDFDSLERHRKLKKYEVRPTGYQQESSLSMQSLLVSEIAKAREHIKNSLEKMDGISGAETTTLPSNIMERLQSLELENANFKERISSLNEMCLQSQKRISALEALMQNQQNSKESKVEEDDDGVDLFASDSEGESEEATRIREERVAAYAAKKSKKPALIAKSSLVLDVKPWDDETDLKEMEKLIRQISTDGLLWGASKFVPVAFGINKLSISCVVEDDKVSIDWLTDEIEKHEDYVQSVDIAAFNKI